MQYTNLRLQLARPGGNDILFLLYQNLNGLARICHGGAVGTEMRGNLRIYSQPFDPCI